MNRGTAILQRGFTLVELLIVVIILAILAAIVVPQFAVSTDEAKVSSLDSTLVNMRGAIDLYYRQHGKYPSAATAVPAAGCGTGTKGAGAADSDTAFREQLSMYTNAAGGACSIGDTTDFKYGPYLKKGTLPNNPISDKNALVVVTTGNLTLAGAGTGATAGGWRFDNKAGKFIADDTAYQDR